MKILIFLLIAVLFAGCAVNRIVPLYARLDRINNPDYPYRIKLYASEHINFNVHQLEFTDYKITTAYYIILKQDSGSLNGSRFKLVEWIALYPTHNIQDYEAHLDRLSFVKESDQMKNDWKGQITIQENEVTIEMYYILSENGKRQPHPANGTYRLQRY